MKRRSQFIRVNPNDVARENIRNGDTCPKYLTKKNLENKGKNKMLLVSLFFFDFDMKVPIEILI